MENWYFILELIGTAAFAVSGAMTAVQMRMDLFGAAILGMTTACGGGIIRDMILGLTPPKAFRDPVYAMVAIAVSILVFQPFVRRFLHKRQDIYDMVLQNADTAGLAIFTMTGIETAMSYTAKPNLFLAVFVGVLTGTGGGVLRDLFANRTPVIFRKYFYASASLIGAVICVVLWGELGHLPAVMAGAAVILVLRILAAHYRWHLPAAKED
ncbi:MAG: TRIC cation channel family protein [Erysipelotrichaceae bacterium]|nr:TRIC cation channel family protein [Erysipelotrichaceae bacterium]